MDWKRALVVVAGDLHTNGTTALALPRVALDDGGEYVASKAQRWLWRQWTEFAARAAERKAALGWPLLLILNGEVADNNYHATTQLITRNESDQLRHAIAVLEPLLDIADAVVVTRGTEAHSGIGSVMDEMIAQDIGALADPEAGDGVRSWQRFRATVAGVSFDVAHHPGTGHARPWTRGGDANRLAAMVTYAYAERRQPPPMVTVRGHNHKPSDSADNHPTRAVILPSWQLSTAFGHRLGGDWLPVGAAWWECDGGEYVLRKFYRDWPLRRAPRIEELMP